jgi:2-polyprenyl-3-methyl-5-hydroxy-6-metoxy-1,4-benzoquinol methylase
MSEDTTPKRDERRRRTTRAGRRRVQRAEQPQHGAEGWQEDEQRTDPQLESSDATTVQDEDDLFASEPDSSVEDEFEDYEALSDLDADAGAAREGSRGASDAAALQAPQAGVPLARAPGADPPSKFDLAEEDSPTYPQIRLAELDLDSKPGEAAPVVVVARATIVGERGESLPAGVARVGAATSTPPTRPSPRPEAPSEVEGAGISLDASGIQLMDDEAEHDTARIKTRSPPPPPPEVRARPAPSGGAPVATVQARRPPPPPGPQAQAPQIEERKARRQVRQWWERFFSEDYLMTVLPPTPEQVAKQVDFIEASIGVGKGGTILDVGCGLGLHAIELTRRGYLVVGLDLSLAMITHAAEAAQQQKLRLSFVHADIREMEFDGAFDGAICMGTTFGFFDEESNRDVLARLRQALKPGGRVLLDVVNRDYVTRFQPNLVWFEGDGCVCMEESEFNYFNARLNVKRTMMREDGHQSNAEYSLRLYSLHELGQLLQLSGFRVIEVSGQEAIRGVFFGAHAPRILMLAERRSAGVPSGRHSGEGVRGESGTSGAPGSAEFTRGGTRD